MLWRYGLGARHLRDFVSELLDKFTVIYDMQARNVSYSTVPDLLMALDLYEHTQKPLRAALMERAVPQLLIDELVDAVMRVNYGQDSGIHSYVGGVTLAGSSSELWAVQGGNALLVKSLIQAAKANLSVSDPVIIIQPQNMQYKVSTKSETSLFDVVIIASPLAHSDLAFPGVYVPALVAYKTTIATIVQGEINPQYFHASSVPDIILTTARGGSINSIGRIAGEGAESIYKIFSSEPLDGALLNKLFTTYNPATVMKIPWKAYPSYLHEQTFRLPFELAQGLYYINAIEDAASAIEMSMIGAKNVAILAGKHLGCVVEGYAEHAAHTEL